MMKNLFNLFYMFIAFSGLVFFSLYLAIYADLPYLTVGLGYLIMVVGVVVLISNMKGGRHDD